MVTEKELSLKRAVPFLLAGILVFVVYIHFFVGIPEIIATLKNVNLVWYSIAIVVLFLNMFVGALAWQFFLRSLAVKVSVQKTFLFSWIGSFVDLLVPAESITGDAARIYMMTKESGENAGKVVASVVSSRILAMAISLGSLVFSCVAVYTIQYSLPTFILNLVLLIIIGTVIVLILIFLCILDETRTQRIIDTTLRFLLCISRGRLKLDSARSKATKAIGAFHGSIGVLLHNPKTLVPPIFFGLISWLLSIIISYLVFVSLDQPVDFILITIVFSVSVNIQSIPLGIPGEVGLVEIVMSSLYGLLGMEAGIATAATVLLRLLTVWFRMFIGFLAVQWIDLKDLVKSLRQDFF